MSGANAKNKGADKPAPDQAGGATHKHGLTLGDAGGGPGGCALGVHVIEAHPLEVVASGEQTAQKRRSAFKVIDGGS